MMRKQQTDSGPDDADVEGWSPQMNTSTTPDVNAVSKQGQVFDVLRRRILDGTYPPGYRLVISSLARELNVSAMPVREALRRLQAEHWVVYRRHAGAEVAPVDAESWAETIEVLALIEGYVTAKAAAHLSAEDLAEMQRLSALEYEDVNNLDIIAMSDHNEAFHRLIADRCPNRVLRREAKIARDRLNALRGHIYFPLEVRGRSSIDEHMELIAMLREGAPRDDVERFARDHRLRTIEARARQLASGQ